MRSREHERRALHLVHAGLDLEPFCLAFDELLREVVPYGVAAWATHDPATGLNTSCTMTGLPKDRAREAELFSYEFAEDEPASYLSLIAAGRTTAVLSQVTDGHTERAARFRHLLAGYGVTDELRAMCWTAGTAWGSATLYRTDGLFSDDDATRVAELAPHVAAGLRLALLRAAATRPEELEEPPGVLEARPDGQVTAMTVAAASWLQLGGPALVTAAGVVAAAIRQRPDWPGASSKLTLADGRVLALSASSVTPDSGRVVVIVDRARPAQISTMLVAAYALTPRQREVLGLVLLGRSMAQIAAHLGISVHTVNDHRKAIYTAIGVTSRAELAARLQSEHYVPHSARGASPSPYGGFLDAAPRG